MVAHLLQSSRDISPEDVVIVSPDVGGVARARAFAKKMGDAPLAIVDKRRQAHNVAKVNKKRMRVKCACVELGMCRRVSPVFCGPQPALGLRELGEEVGGSIGE